MPRITLTKTLLAGAMAAGFAVSAQADYPSANIEMVVGYSAGGGSDVLARSLAPHIEEALGEGTRIAVINRPGGGGEIGFTAVADANPDGYTIGIINVPSILNPMIERSPSYDLDSFQLLANVVTEPGAVVVPANSPHNSLEEWMAHVEANPGSVSVGNSGGGGAMHTALIRFLRASDLSVNHIPFAGGAPSRAALLGSHVDASVMGISEAGPLHNDGELKILGVMAAERIDLVPDVPTMGEVGTEIVAGSYRGLMAPAGLPDEVRDALVDAVAQAVQSDAFLASADDRLLLVDYMAPDEYAALIDETYTEMSAIWDEDPWAE
ncbi:tripartite tricarboxylate transporter substrate binding protein [Halomonas salipaludis]|uniref:3-phosphoglycerate dehydrogenase n=1 Tax=Halomonas salipaludis TaxID=2032625 RepID=A0A2A2ETP8_9GAMM|nr:tripartite tricarboxylate transporter substrate binding protein [Halomonas salipaludis]PAU76506.1 3-phosphoglycerate dehydrogenase [Halomonas salipaludis]